MAGYSPYDQYPPAQGQGSGEPPSHYGQPVNGMPGDYPPQGFIPTGAPVHTYCTAQQYTFVQGMGFMLRTPEDIERQSIRHTGRMLAFSLFFYLILYFGLKPLLSYFILRILYAAKLGYNASDEVTLITLLLLYPLALLIPFLVYKHRVGIPTYAALPMRAPRASLVLPGVFMMLGLSVIGNNAADAVSGALRSIGLYVRQNSVPLPESVSGIVLYMINFVLIAPVLEELVFRGIVMQSLRPYGDGFAVVISALVFSLLHLNILAMPYAFLGGLALGYFVLRSGSLVTGMVLHLFNNLFAVVFDLFTRHLAPQPYALCQGAVFAVYLLLGVVALLVALRFNPNLFYILPSSTILGDSAKLRLILGSAPMVLIYIAVGVLLAGSLAFIGGTVW